MPHFVLVWWEEKGMKMRENLIKLENGLYIEIILNDKNYLKYLKIIVKYHSISQIDCDRW